MKQIEVTILGQSYILGCADGGETALLEAVSTVDREMSAIRDGGKVKARERIAVLAALNLAYALAARNGTRGSPVQLQKTRTDASSQTGLQTPAGAPEEGARNGTDDADLDGLIRRVDQALFDHGRLL